MPRDAHGRFVGQAPARIPDPAPGSYTLSEPVDSTPVNDTLSRTIRTLIQVGAVQVVLQLYQAFPAFGPLNDTQYAALTTFLTVLLTLGQNWVETTTGHALMRNVDPV